MKRRLGTSALLALSIGLTELIGLSACSSLNPFASEPKNKPAELTAITPSADIRTDWQTSVGRSGDAVFTPAVVGSSVYAAAEDGTLARFDDGTQVWRINVGQTISGGVGSNGSWWWSAPPRARCWHLKRPVARLSGRRA